ncbi:MAG TPA: SRPBCC family protein [Candidatus Limnocylindrales bacterium]|nr:SRPBCC family protein [Candidatus Limnocylindrales bacterium]
MAILRERIETVLPLDDAFAFVADFANSAHWDPGVASAERMDAGPLGVGARYRLGIRIGGRVAPMDYLVTAFEPLRRVVLAGRGSGVDAEDEIVFEATPTGTRIDYTADIRLRGVMRLATPFAAGALARIARDARDGMQRELDRRAAAA